MDDSSLTNEQVVQLYYENEKEISAVWQSMPDSASMRDAVLDWLRGWEPESWSPFT